MIIIKENQNCKIKENISHIIDNSTSLFHLFFISIHTDLKIILECEPFFGYHELIN